MYAQSMFTNASVVIESISLSLYYATIKGINQSSNIERHN